MLCVKHLHGKITKILKEKTAVAGCIEMFADPFFNKRIEICIPFFPPYTFQKIKEILL